ncbi:Envelope-like protein [Abeliophyllum distichum]|uniref:Envelope-like protein n=1 Tax=Abeliophyllum distichum TaxID=126358 RepID=A0ABD1QZD8_9LAMI
MANLINFCGWEKVASKTHLAYPLLVKEFLSNFNHTSEEPEADHWYTTWVRGKWIKFSPAVIENYYGLTANDIEHILANLHMTQVTQFLYGRVDAWPLVGPKFLHNQLTKSLRIFHIFVCHNIDPISHRTDFNESRAQFLYHLASGHKIDLENHMFRFIVDLASQCTRAADNPVLIPAAETDHLLRQIFTQLSEQGRVLSSIQHTQLAMQHIIDHMRIEMNSLKASNTALKGEQRTINYSYDDVNRRMLHFARLMDDIYTIVSEPSAPSALHHESISDGPSNQP